MNKLIKKLLVISTFFLILSSISIISILWIYSNKLPDYKFLKNYKPPVSSKLYSGNGQLIIDFSSEKRIFIPYESIPQKVINSFLSSEDKNFFNHPGVDAKGVLRAIYNNIFNVISSKRLEGASTITQQVAKNFLLSNEVSLDRKIKEAILAFRIERALSKKRILELYLNQIYLGEGSYGVASASLKYFDKPISDLNYVEASINLGQEDEARNWMNKTRFRVGMPAVTETGTDLLDKYINERRIELAFEEHRYHDARRWLIAPSTLGRGVQKINITATLKAGKSPIVPYRHDKTTYDYTYEVQNETSIENRTWKDKMYYRPISRDEMNKNSLLVQNPGYD